MTKKKILLVVGGGQETKEYIKLLSRNYNFILIDKDKNCPSRALSSRFIEKSIYDPEPIIKAIFE